MSGPLSNEIQNLKAKIDRTIEANNEKRSNEAFDQEMANLKAAQEAAKPPEPPAIEPMLNNGSVTLSDEQYADFLKKKSAAPKFNQ